MADPDNEAPGALHPLVQAFPLLRGLPKGTQVFAMEEDGHTLLYNITTAQALTSGRAPALLLEVSQLAELVYLRGAAPEPAVGFAVDPDWAMTRDLAAPLLLVYRSPELGGTPAGQVIDGWHRVYKALRQGVALLPAVVITPDEEPAIRLAPTDEELRHLVHGRNA